MNTIEYRAAQTDDFNALQALLAELGWGDRTADDERFRAMLDGAD